MLLCPTLVLLVAGALPPAQDDPVQDGPVEADTPREPRLGVELAATAGDVVVTFEELDELILWRHGRSQEGRAALRQLLELRVLEELAAEQELAVTDRQLALRWAELDEEIRASGVEGGLEAYLESNDVSHDTFRDYLRLAILHEMLTRRALEVDDETEVSGEQQTQWLAGVLEERGYEELPHPWSDGVVARSGELAITRDELAEHLRTVLGDEELSDACYELLLEKRVLARLPDLGEDALAAAVDEEIERRRQEAEADERFAGVSYERLLEAQGLSLDALRRDPAIRVAALARLWIDRTHDDEALRAAYAAEREFFDGLFGEGLELSALFLRAARFANELNPRTFEEAEEELIELRGRMRGLEDFRRLATTHSEDTATREQGGAMGIVTRGAVQVPEPLRAAAFGALDRARAAGAEDASGEIVGPVRIQGGVVLLCLGERRPAPPWEAMADHVHRELRRRFLGEVLPRSSVTTWLQRG